MESNHAKNIEWANRKPNTTKENKYNRLQLNTYKLAGRQRHKTL